ncbi:hypothetical protein [Joostella sp. CR20]|uniref:hypothetical protein n=1 Tax=Joostella sp. CR20 TaxID=2804312 RepID=UPI00313CFDCC
MKEVRIIKGLKSQLKTLEADAEILKLELSNKQKEYVSKLEAVKNLKEKISNLDSSNTLKVSEHAIIRYFERVKGYDISEIENEILSNEVVSLVQKLGGTGGYPSGGFKVLMKNYTVTTII